MRAAVPDWYGFPTGAGASSSISQVGAAAAPMGSVHGGAASAQLYPSIARAAQPPQVPPPWEAFWSQEHEAFYFHNCETGDTTWEKPVESID
jgi:hypothetical protein